MRDEGRNVEVRTFCFGTFTLAILVSLWLFGRSIAVGDLYMAVATAFLYAVTIPVSDPQSVLFAVMCTLLPMWFVSPVYLMDWNTIWQKWPFPTVVALVIGYVAFWMHFLFREWNWKWMTESQYIKSFEEVENLPQPIGPEG